MIVDDELRATFRDEIAVALDELIRLRDGLAQLDDEKAGERMLAAYRIMHNIKGAARLTGLDAVEPVAHAAEEMVDALRMRGGRPTDPLLESLARTLAAILDHVEGGVSAEELHARAVEALGEDVLPSLPAVASDVASVGVQDAMIRVRTTQLDRLMSVAGEVIIDTARRGTTDLRLDEIAEALREHISTLPLDSRPAIHAIASRFDALLTSARVETQHAAQTARELSESVRAVRLVPLAGYAAAWRRIVEDAANDLGKRVRLDVDTGEIALDRRVLDGLRDPMLHLLRNAVDHGIEGSTDRAIAGKDVVGTIVIRARSAGPNVELEIRDDGRGVDATRLVTRAIESGLLSIAEAEGMSQTEKLELAFSAGLSTATEVTNLSGRGIGLDVVRLRIGELGGRIELTAERGVGTRFRLSLPADVVSTKGLVVRAGESRFAIPIVAVDRTIRVPADSVRDVEGFPAIAQAGEAPLRLRWLAGLLGEVDDGRAGHLFVVVVSEGHSRVGLVVDEVRGEADFVVRPLPWNVKRANGVSGATMLGDGSLALVLDVADLASLRAERGHEVRRREATSVAAKRILIADDSVTSRLLQRNILTSAGYEVLVANDGREALELLGQATVDLVVTDVEMPRLTGIELTRAIRANPKTKSLPIIVVTSLARPEDVEAGAAAGADEYIVKGRFDHRTLLEAVARLT